MSGLFVGNRFFFVQNKPLSGNFLDWLWGLGWVLNIWFDRKFSEEKFSTLVFFHKNAYSARYFQKTVFFGGRQTPIKKKGGDGYCRIFSIFFQTPTYSIFSNQIFVRTVCTFFSLFAYTKMHIHKHNFYVQNRKTRWARCVADERLRIPLCDYF